MSLEEKKKTLEINKITLGIDEMEIRILEREEDIQRLVDNINISKDKLKQLKGEM